MHTEKTEREKYQFIWNHEDYRHSSPGQRSAARVVKAMGAASGSSINDYGAGTGKASVEFSKMGMNPLCIDIADNSQSCGVPFVQACLWNMENVPISDYGYCVDVLEHIPLYYVDRVLGQIRKKTKNSVYLQIAHFPDEWHGEVLHLTVKPREWWREVLSKYFVITKEEEAEPNRTGFYCRPLVEIEIRSHLNVDDETILKNIQYARKLKLPEIKSGKLKSDPIAIVGGGPSLKKSVHALGAFKKIVATNNTHDFLIKNNIKPWACVIVDSKPECSRFVEHPKKYIKYFISSKCHKSVFDNLKGQNVTVIHDWLDIGEPQDVTRICGGSTVSLKCLNIFGFMGYREFYLFGVDCCYSGDEHHAYEQKQNDGETLLDLHVKGRVFKSSPWMIKQAQEFQEFIKHHTPEYKIGVVGDGVLYEILRCSNG